jgi:hypothetical protein
MKSSYKKLCTIFILILVPFIAGHYLIWKNVTEELLTAKYDGGDLSRMGYILGSKLFRKNQTDLPRQHIEIEDNKDFRKVDVITLGDSFANFGGGGRNRFYQDYIASLNNLEVENVRPFAELNFLTAVAVLNNNGYFDRVKPKYVIVSSSEKLCMDRFISPVDLDKNIPLEKLLTYKRNYYAGGHADVKFINTGNLNYLKYKLLYHFSPNAVFSNTYKVKLSRDFFSVRNSDILLFYKNDVKSIKGATDITIGKLNDNMNRMADMLAKKGIKFYFMPCADKYNMYSDYIVNNKFPKSVFFEKLRKLPKRYVLIDTKDVLLREIAAGEKDVYYPDDSHWSWKASSAIFSYYRFD